MLFDEIIKARKKEDRREDDALQVLLDLGDSTADVISVSSSRRQMCINLHRRQFIMGTLFAGIINSGLMSAWIFIFLDQEPEWRDKVAEELRMLLDKYAPSSEKYPSLGDRFSRIPPQAWESEMPILEVRRLIVPFLREAYNTGFIGLLARDDSVCVIINNYHQSTYGNFSLIATGAMLRRITQGDIEVSGRTIPNGSECVFLKFCLLHLIFLLRTFLTYLAGETHGNPNIYPNPSRLVKSTCP